MMDYLKRDFDAQDNFIYFGYFIILFFALTRPLTATDTKIPFLLDIYSIGVSYFLMVLLLISLRKIKIERTGILILIFCLYCIMSFAWGSNPQGFTKLLLPFVFFFSAITFFKTKQQIEHFLVFYKVGFFIPLLISTIFIILGIRIQMVEFWNQVPRHAGVYSGSHVLAYQMLFFSFIFCFYQSLSIKSNTVIKCFATIMLVLSVYCLYQSHTRTALIGFILFWSIFLWGFNRKYFFIFSFICILFAIFFSSLISNIIWKKVDQPDINRATSGRVELWEDYYQGFRESSLPEKLLGKGIGWKGQGAGFHSDYLSLLVTTGIIGLMLYLLILISLLYDIFLRRHHKLSYLFLSILISVGIMNFGSNAVISRFELSTLFWLLMGLQYKFSILEN
jgi:O-antigen ligase